MKWVMDVTASPLFLGQTKPMEYVIYRELENRELVFVATRDTLIDAERLVQSLQELWPAVYPIRPTEKKAETH